MITITILYIILALLLFGVLIFVHELGHYIAARACGVKVLEFSIGMGPTLVKWQSKKTDIKYSLRALPVGGFCAMEGENELDEDGKEIESEEDKDPRSYKNKPAWMKIIILVAGPLMNIILGVLMTIVLVIGSRGEDGKILVATNTVADFTENAISLETGLMANDTVVKVGNVNIHTGTELAYEISIQGKEIEKYTQYVGENGEETVEREVVSLDLTVIRDGKEVVLEDVKFLASVTEGSVFGNTDFRVYRDGDVTFLDIVKNSWYRSLNSVKMVWDSLIGLLGGRFALSSVSGPVGTTQVITQAASAGWYTLLYIFVVISMNLGVFNLIPILPLDGGHVVFALYELIARKPAPRKLREACQIIGVALMFGLMIVVTIKDVIKLF